MIRYDDTQLGQRLGEPGCNFTLRFRPPEIEAGPQGSDAQDWLCYVLERERYRTALAISMGIRQGRRATDPKLFPDPQYDWLRARGWKIIE